MMGLDTASGSKITDFEHIFKEPLIFLGGEVQCLFNELTLNHNTLVLWLIKALISDKQHSKDNKNDTQKIINNIIKDKDLKHWENNKTMTLTRKQKDQNTREANTCFICPLSNTFSWFLVLYIWKNRTNNNNKNHTQKLSRCKH